MALSTLHTEHISEDETRAKVPSWLKVERLLGAGTFAYVYKAIDRSKGIPTCDVALKFFAARKITRQHLRLAANEISILKILDHENIIKFRDSYISDKMLYITMVLADCGNLTQFIKPEIQLHESDLLFIIKRLASALDYMHQFNIIHGDIKPENILVADLRSSYREPTLKICDFGISTVQLKNTIDCKFKFGSFFYMAPEVHFGLEVDYRCDNWSLGIIMYEIMFCGRTIYHVDKKDQNTYKKMLQRKTPIYYQGSAGYSEACHKYLRSLLQFDKLKRLDVLTNNEFVKSSQYVNADSMDENKFVEDASKQIKEAFRLYARKAYGFSLRCSYDAIVNLSIYYNILVEKQKITNEKKELIFHKIEEYKKFGDKVENSVLLASKEKEASLALTQQEAEIRSQLSSTPSLVAAYDMGCTAYMYEREGSIEKAMQTYRQALDLMFAGLGQEPDGHRKEVIGGIIKNWLDKIDEYKACDIIEKEPATVDFPNQQPLADTKSSENPPPS